METISRLMVRGPVAECVATRLRRHDGSGVRNHEKPVERGKNEAEESVGWPNGVLLSIGPSFSDHERMNPLTLLFTVVQVGAYHGSVIYAARLKAISIAPFATMPRLRIYGFIRKGPRIVLIEYYGTQLIYWTTCACVVAVIVNTTLAP